jgi:WD40 repeat protein
MTSTSLNLTAEFKLPSGILGASVSDDGASLVAACMDGVYLVDPVNKSSERIGRHGSYVSSAAFLPEQNAVVSSGYDGVMQWRDLTTRELTRELRLHNFWSWDMSVSPNRKLIASVTGQYLAGGYKYEPLPEQEPSVKIVAAKTGEVRHSLPHVPSVQAVAFSPDGQFVAAGNLMGEVRIWNADSGQLAASFTTPDFTSWGIIKSHSYLGGIFALKFTPDGNELLLTGMGPMRDPMAGNGRQLWQKWAWTEPEPRKLDETHKGESGEGLMETLAVHPDGKHFVMGGRLRGGDWNAAMFDLASGARTATLKTGFRVTEAMFTADGKQMILVGAQGQPKKMVNGVFPDFGRLEVYDVAAE